MTEAPIEARPETPAVDNSGSAPSPELPGGTARYSTETTPFSAMGSTEAFSIAST